MSIGRPSVPSCPLWFASKCWEQESRRLLVETDHVSTRIAEARGDLGRVGADGLHDRAAVGDDGLHGYRYAVDHDVKHQAGCCAGRASENPGAAHLAYGIVKGDAAVVAFADVPSEYALVELRRASNVSGGHLALRDPSVRKKPRDMGAPSTRRLLQPISEE